MLKLLRTGLAIAGIVCTICFLTFSGKGGHGKFEFTLGSPDHWFVWTNDGFDFMLNRWSVAIGIVGMICWYGYFRLRRISRLRDTDE